MRILIFAFASLIWFHNTALACAIGPVFFHYPSCTIPLPDPDERVTVIGNQGRSALSSLHLGNPHLKTRVIVVHVAPSTQRHYLVLQAHYQTIWQIEGDTDSISRVIVLGATTVGAAAAGVTGIAADRVHFTTPDLAVLDAVQKPPCTRTYKACTAWQWFVQINSDRMSFYPPPKQPRQQADAILVPGYSRLPSQDNLITIVHPEIADQVVTLDPALVVSPQPAQPYTVLPRRPGLQALVDSGALVPSGSDMHRTMINNYAEAFSARYRSRFDPEFMFTPTMDYIVTRATTLPPELPRTALMVAHGVPAPAFNGNSHDRVCLYFEVLASKPAISGRFDSVLCRHQAWSPRDQDRDVLSAALDFDTLGAGVDCRMAPIPDDSHIAVVALSEGPHRRYRNDPIRQIDLEVMRDGPVALYLSIEGGPVRWNLTGPDIIAVYMRNGTEYGMHQVVMNGEPYEQTRLGIGSNGCPFFAPLFPNRLGPAIAHLDEMLNTLTGHRIDQLITLRDTGKTLPAIGAPIPRYVVE